MTSHTLKRNDAAKAATSPRHAQSNPTKDQEMNDHTSITPAANSKAIRDRVAGLECNLAIIADLLGCIAELADKHYDPGAIVTLVLLAERECSESKKAQSELFTLTRPTHAGRAA